MRGEDEEERGPLSPLAYTPHIARVRGLVTDEIRSVVRALTAQLCADGLPAEKVLVAVKTVVRELIAPSMTNYVDSQGREYRREQLFEDASRWCIECYYEARHRTGESGGGSGR